MKKFVIFVVSEGVKKYVKIDTQSGKSVGVSDKNDATELPSRAVASSVLSAIRPAIKKEKLNCIIGMEVK